MSYLLSIDPGLRKSGAALWHGGELAVAKLIEPESDGPEMADVVEAMTHAICEWPEGPLRITPRMRAERTNTGHGLFLVCEYPQTYGGRAGKGDANDLISVALVAGAILGRLGCPSQLVLPREWKGGIPKPQSKAEYERDGYPVEERARAKLSPAEAARVEWPRDWRKRLDVADALGLGLHAFKR